MVPSDAQTAALYSNQDKVAENNPNAATRQEQDTPSLPKAPIDWLSCVRQSLIDQGVQGEALNIIIDSWRTSTRKQYKSSICSWIDFCKDHHICVMTPSLPQLLEFLTLQSKRLGYSALGTVRSALSSFITIDGIKAGEHLLVSRFMTGIFNRKPCFPRYVETWDPQIVLDHLRSYPDVKFMTLKQLTLKLTMFMALVSAQRTRTLKLLSTENMVKKSEEFTFRVLSLLKQSSAGGGTQRHLAPIVFKKYPDDNKLCVFTVLEEYLKRTSALRGSCSQLLLCYTKPCGPASKDTIRRWIKEVMLQAGIVTTLFKPHSTRSASTSVAVSNNVPINDILMTNGWRSSSIFAKYYNKPVAHTNQFAEGVLSKP